MSTTHAFRLLAVSAIFGWVAFDAAAADQTTDAYLQHLEQLDASRPESVCVARGSLRHQMDKASQMERAKMFRAFRAFYGRSADESSPAFSAAMNRYVNDYEGWQGSYKDLLSKRMDISKAGQRWFDCGYVMADGEGMLYAVADPTALLEFADRLPADLRSYVRFRAKEDAEIVGGDATLALTWEELRSRLVRWENFARRHTGLTETSSEVDPQIRSLARLYFFGSDNTPTFDSATGRIDPKLIESWRRFAHQDQSSRYHSLIASLLPRIDHQGQTITKSDDVLFEQSGLGADFDRWMDLWLLRQKEARP